MGGFEEMPKNQSKSPEQGSKKEKEQTPEEILEILKIAVKNECEAKLTISDKKGDNQEKAIVEPYEIDGRYLVLTTEDGIGISIELERIKSAELPSEGK